MNDEMIQKLEKIYELISLTYELDDNEKKQKCIENLTEFRSFYNDFSVYSYFLMYAKLEDEQQVVLSNKFFQVIKWIVSNSQIFDQTEYYDYIPDGILNSYTEREMYNVNALSRSSSYQDFVNIRNYISRRIELEEIINEKNEKSTVEIRYINSHNEYMKWYYSQSLTVLEENFIELSEEDILSFVSEVEESSFLDSVVLTEKKTLNYAEENLVFQYFMFALKMKNKFRPEEIIDDKIVQYLWNGKIKNKAVIKLLLGDDEKEYMKKSNIFIGDILDIENIFTELLKKEGYDGNFYRNLNDHFTKVGLSAENIFEIIKHIIPKCGKYSALQFLADLEIPKDSTDYILNAENEDFSFVKYNPYIIDLLKNVEKDVLNGKCIDIPYDYVVKKIPNLTSEAFNNIYTLVKSGYYKENTENLEKLLLQNRFLDETKLLSEQIEFFENDSIYDMVNKAKLAFYNRQIIPYDIAKRIIKANFDEHLPLDIQTGKACIASIIHNNLKENGIDIGNRIFFGKDQWQRGLNRSSEYNLIWINEQLVKNFVKTKVLNSDDKTEALKKKTAVFVTVFHENKHAKQFDNIEYNRIDFLTYNFIKEQILRKYDKNFYDANYNKMFIEEDARQYGIIDAMKFLNSIGIKDFDCVYPAYKRILETELVTGNITQDSNKKLSFRGNKRIHNTDFLSRLIKNNSDILNRYNGILKIEFNEDGTTKDIHTMLDEYNVAVSQLEREENRETKVENLYSIYYGLFKQKIARGQNISQEDSVAMMNFYKLSDSLISLNDLRIYSLKADPQVIQNIMQNLSNELQESSENKGDTNSLVSNSNGIPLNKGDELNGNFR